MANIAQLREELNFLSTQVSERTKWLAGGVIASGWSALVAIKEPQPMVSGLILLAVSLSVLSLLLDFLQYYVPYFYTRRLEQLAQRVEDKTAKYKDNPSLLRDLRFRFFHLKTIAALLAAAVLLSVQGFIVVSKMTATAIPDGSPSVSLTIGKSK